MCRSLVAIAARALQTRLFKSDVALEDHLNRGTVFQTDIASASEQGDRQSCDSTRRRTDSGAFRSGHLSPDDGATGSGLGSAADVLPFFTFVFDLSFTAFYVFAASTRDGI